MLLAFLIIDLTISNPKLWSLTNPNLYNKVTLKENNENY
ncbi:MAG: hypothetical protein H6611_03860 [Ignavibacteriales bacterium]|nr:hypothetical protein [Ignavibacteriales bacterium]